MGRQLANLNLSCQASSVFVLSHSISLNPLERVCNTENMISVERRNGLQGHEKYENPGTLMWAPRVLPISIM